MLATPVRSSDFYRLLGVGLTESQADLICDLQVNQHRLEYYPLGSVIHVGVKPSETITVVGWGEFEVDLPSSSKVTIHMTTLGPPPTSWGATSMAGGAGGGSGSHVISFSVTNYDELDKKIASLTEAINTMAKSLEVLHEENDALRARVYSVEERLTKTEGELRKFVNPSITYHTVPRYSTPGPTSVSYPEDYEKDVKLIETMRQAKARIDAATVPPRKII